MLLSSILLAISLSASAALVQHDASFVPDYILRGTTQNISVACESRYSTVINGTSPAPPLYMKEGQTTWVRVFNDQDDQNLTVHWHGLSQRTSPFADGTPQVSQWPIPPRHYFDYEIRPEVGDAGSYFYHSHVGFQAISAAGPLIVTEAKGVPPYKYDAERILTITDYYNKTDANITAGLLNSTFVWSGETNAILVNGHSGTKAGNETTIGSTCAPAIISVEPGKNYRFRFISATAISSITLGIEDHSNITVIEADGTYTQPWESERLQVASGQRFDILFTTKSIEEIRSTNKTTYWVQYENRFRPANVSGYALLEYQLPTSNVSTLPQKFPSPPPLTLPQKAYDWAEYSLQPLDPDFDPFPPLSRVTRTVYITTQQLIQGPLKTGSYQWEQNGDVWQPEKIQTPYLVDVYEKGQSAIPDYNASIANGGWDPKSLAFPAQLGEVLDIVWLSNSGRSGGWDAHPFHAHGGHYWDLGSGNGTYNATENEKKFANYTPTLRDTTMLYPYATSGLPNTTAGWRAWRVKVRYPGAWLMHCHILQHMIMGMQTVWVFGNANQIINLVPDPDVTGYLTYGGDVYGNSSHEPAMYHHYPS